MHREIVDKIKKYLWKQKKVKRWEGGGGRGRDEK